MPRVDLEKYYQSMFKDSDKTGRQQFREINRAHVISSEYYDVHCSRNSILYRDRLNHIRISVESNMSHNLVIYFDSFLKDDFANALHNITPDLLKKRLNESLNYLNIRHIFE